MSRRSSRRAPQGEPYRDHGARDAYLDRLGVIRRPPSLEALTELQRAHVERVPYETIWLALGRQVGIDVGSSVSRILSGWGGYCFHLNGAFHWLLGELGYDARLHRGGVQGGRQDAPPGATGEHAVITVRLDSADWLVDVGLGSCVGAVSAQRRSADVVRLLKGATYRRFDANGFARAGMRVERRVVAAGR
ncbi:arylamine N-acetyltransferase family protein [Luteipulveratus flavus]|uniref:Arylamine N-acetyltransferase n=1 Tax=Luteipulveratus flavus TaxID=3031728 RepID=A0ABT6C9E4_9MICO|nr:arylamine N-acetyltransferase [Luteipulveratus sp. YIM 133296]MDF8265529.1 arylamine N-acetyltransferase [Luteipulveratus sp. YIM 133296]